MKILVLAEAASGQLKRSSLELLTLSQSFSVDVICFGQLSEISQKTLSSYGVEKVFTFQDSVFLNYNAEAFTAAFRETINKVDSKYSFVFGNTSSLAKDLFPRVAASLGAGFNNDVVSINFESNPVSVFRPVYSGKALTKVDLSSSVLQFVLMRPNQVIVQPGQKNSATSVESSSLSLANLKTLVREVVQGTSKAIDLTEANIIVSGGRGLKEAANFKLLDDLANTLGATVGASRAVVDAGWVPHEMQVGQTGKTVAPSLYIAVGISGAIQHLAGMSGSKVIVAINSEANAPIFSKATYGIVGDALSILPLLTEEFKLALGRS